MKKSIAVLSVLMSFALSCSVVFADDLPSGEAPENEPTPTVEEVPNADEPETEEPNTEEPDTNEPETDGPNTEDPKEDPLVDTTNQMLGNAPATFSEEGTDATPAENVPVGTRIASNPDISEDEEGNLFLTAETDDNGNSTRTIGTPIVNGNKYWVNKDGFLQSGWLTLGDWSLYFDAETYIGYTGLKSAPSPLPEDNGEVKRYMFSRDGIKQNYAGTPVIDGKKYWFGHDGALHTGWLNLGNWSLYFDPDTCVARTGLAKAPSPLAEDNGQIKTYMFNNNGVKYNYTGTPVINGDKYWFAADSALLSGWLNLGDWSLYFDPDTYKARIGLAEAPSPLAEDNGQIKTYMFNNDGMKQNYAGTPVINGDKYWVAADGALRSGWLNLGDRSLYFDPDSYEARIGLAEAPSQDDPEVTKRYMFNKDGVKQNYAGTPVIDGNKYWFGTDGSLNTGWLNLGNWSLYFDDETCIAYTGLKEAPSPIESDGGELKTYMFNKDGVKQNYAGTPVIDGHKYWFEKDGALRSGWLKLGAWKLYFNPTTYIGAVGETVIDGKTYLFSNDSAVYTGTVRYGIYIYVIGSDGVVQSKSVNRAYALASNVLDRVGRNLRSAYNYSAGLTYWRHTADPNAYEYNAIYAFENGRTNCHGMAATFYYMAKLLGYDAHIVSGYVLVGGGGMNPHSWCELVIHGTTYVFDPNFTNETGRNGYQINYGNSGTWRYTNYHRVI